MLNYKIKQDEDGEETLFTLAKGTQVKFGSEIITFTEAVNCKIDKEISRDAVVELIHAAGQAALNAPNFTFREEKEGKTIEVRYGGRGQRIESLVEEIQSGQDESKSDNSEPAKTGSRRKKLN